MREVEQIVSEFRNEADIDFVSLPHIASAVEHDLGLEGQGEICRYALEVVKVTSGYYLLKMDGILPMHRITLSLWRSNK